MACNTDKSQMWRTGTPVFCHVGVRALVSSCSSANLRGLNHAAPALDEQITR
ncbi:MAG TPA: hypothetical protein VNF72_00745 [Myxococcota bacterium]|nr:hypothetical protein [Myxococcota bacterium]